jgi:hypothetical protein
MRKRYMFILSIIILVLVISYLPVLVDVVFFVYNSIIKLTNELIKIIVKILSRGIP